MISCEKKFRKQTRMFRVLMWVEIVLAPVAFGVDTYSIIKGFSPIHAIVEFVVSGIFIFYASQCKRDIISIKNQLR